MDLNDAKRNLISAIELYKSGSFDSSIYLMRSLLPSFKESRQIINYGIACNGLAENYLSIKKYDSARFYMNLTLKQKDYENDSITRVISKTHRLLGIYFGQLDLIDSALIQLRLALEISKRDASPGYAEVEALTALGWIFSKMAYSDSALHYLEQSLVRRRDLGLEDDSILAYSYINMAHNSADIGDYSYALLLLQKALNIWDKKLSNNHPGMLSVHYYMGTYNMELGNYETALKWFNKNLDEELNSEVKMDIARTLLKYGICKDQMGDSDVLPNYHKAIKLLKSIYGESHMTIGQTYETFADYYSKRRRHDSTLFYLRNAQSIYTDIFGEKSLYLAKNLRSQGEEYFNVGNWERARHYSKLAMSAASFSNLSQEGSDLNVNPEYYKSKYLESAAIYKSFLEDTSNVELLKNSLESNTKSIDIALEALDLYDATDSKYHLQGELSSYFEQALKKAFRLFQLTGNIYYKKLAFTIAEQNRSRILLKNILQSRAQKFSKIPESTLSRIRYLRKKMVYLKSKMVSINTSDLAREYLQVKDNYDSLILHLERTIPNYWQLTHNINFINYDEVQMKLAREEALLEYYVGTEIGFVFVITKSEFEMIEIPDGDHLISHINMFNRHIKKYEKQKLIEASKILYNQTIAPVRNKLNAISKLIIIPHDELAYLPFGALISNWDNNPSAPIRYLIEDYEIAYNYSATLAFQPKSHQQQEEALLAFAPVNFSEHILTTDKNFGSGGEKYLRPLHQSKSEVLKIEEIFKKEGLNAIVKLGNSASEQNFKELSGGFNYIHIATHTMVDHENPDNSTIFFSQSMSDDKGNDGRLTFAETFNLDLNASVLVLNSCDSNAGAMKSGEGVLSMSRGFYFSGAKHIIGSLWPINDKLATDFSVDFYDKLIDKKQKPSQAFRTAKLNMLKNPTTSFPGNWAGYVLIE